ncbi:putative leucine-rich repeat-containing protein DDB_G0290503 [Euwallacea fornicatus]|uniref:putative leucine-rich repeat-containing protein DDB_G0290503 n=1 Tax=Euwallacea fornicatus TaxID=995702 RepID=UPI0033900035
MDEDISSANWVLVNEIDCAEEAISLISLNSVVLDSDQESDHSISIISECPADSCSEDEISVYKEQELVHTESEDEIQFEKAYEQIAEAELGSHAEVVDEKSSFNHENSDLDGSFSDLQFPQHEDISQELIPHSQLELSDGRDKDITKEKSFSLLAVGFLITILSSEIIRHYLYEKNTSQSPSDATYMGTFSDDQLNKAVMELCVYKQRSKGDFSEQAVQKCVNHRLKKLKKDKMTKKDLPYVQLKEHYDNLKDTKEDVHVFSPIDDAFQGSYEKTKHSRWRQEETPKDTKMFESKYNLKNNKMGRYESKMDDIKERSHSKKNEHVDKIKKKKPKQKNQLKDIKEKAKSLWDKQKLKRQYHRKDDPNEEWYIKYNPLTDTIEVINITTLPENQHLTIIKNKDTMLNGEWYFRLYGNSREQLRKKEQEAEWYFKRGHRHKTNKQIRAKWYFEYMSARGKTKYV